jgi:uncharacterized protein GlcG (DUF336 family)
LAFSFSIRVATMSNLIDDPASAPRAAQTAQEAAEYERWFAAQVQAALLDTGPGFSHEQVMQDAYALIDEISQRKARAIAA